MFAYYEWLLLAFPVIGACTNLLIGERLSRRGQNAVAMAGATGPLLVVLPLLVGITLDPSLVGRPTAFPWMRIWSGARFVEARFALRLDALSILLAATLLVGAWFLHLHATRSSAPARVGPLALAQLNGALSTALIVLLADDLVFLLLGWSLSGWLTYGLLRVPRSRLTAADEGERVPILVFWGTSDVLLLVATAIVGRRFASLSLDALIAMSPAPGLQQIPALSLAVAGALACAAVLLRVGVFPWNLPLPATSTSWGRAMARGLVLFLPGVYLLARLYPLLAPVPVLSTAIAWWGALTALLMGLSAASQPASQRSARPALAGQASLLLLAISTGSLPAALAFLPVSALSQALVLLVSTSDPLDPERRVPGAGSGWMSGLGLASLIGLPPLGAFPFCAHLLAALFRTNVALWGLSLGSLFLLAAGGARAIRSRGADSDARPRVGTLWVLATVIVVLGLSSLTSPPLLVGLLGPAVGRAPDQPAWWWFVIVTAITGAGALVGYAYSEPFSRLRCRIAMWTSGWYGVERVWERVAIQPALAAGSFLARAVEPGLANSSLGLLVRWVAGPSKERRALSGLPVLVVLFLMATAAILIYLLLVR